MLGWGDVNPGGSSCSSALPGEFSKTKPKTINEYEEELIELKRDNYDLRMRIYLMEEEYECNQSSLDQTASNKLHPSFAQLKELYTSNNLLKEEITKLKKQLCEKEDLILKAASAVETLEKTHQEKLDLIQQSSEKQCQELLNTIASLQQELIEVKDKEKIRLDQGVNITKSESSGLLDDSNIMYAMAFGLPLPQGKAAAIQAKQEEIARVANLELQIAKLERDYEEESSRRIMCDSIIDKIRLELKQSEEDRRHLADELKHRQQELVKAHTLIEDNSLALAQLKDELVNITSKSSKDSQIKFNPDSNDKVSFVKFSEIQEELNQLRDQLKTQKLENIRMQGENMKAMKTIQGLVKQNKALTRDLESNLSSDMKLNKNEITGESSVFNKDNRITELETEVSVLKEKLKSINFGSTEEIDSGVALLKRELESKNTEIESLNEELKKRTFNLQELVNKELWDKNREIEKLNLTVERKQSEFNLLKQELNKKNQEIVQLQQDMKRIITFKDFDFKENYDPNQQLNIIIDEKLKSTIEDNRRLKEEVETLNTKLVKENDVNNKLGEECNRWRLTAEESEKNRKELINACTLLTTRLEELSCFLESLLPSLGSRKRKMVQQAIQKSREMSRSFSFVEQSSLSLSIPLLPDVSQVDFCSGEETLGKINEKGVFIDSSENDEVSKLRNQVESLVEKLQTKQQTPDSNKNVTIAGVWNLETQERLDDITAGSLLDSLSDLSEDNTSCAGHKKSASVSIVAHSTTVPESRDKHISPTPICQSESDGGWSEPDRNVSKQRIGINDVVTPSKPINSSEESAKSNKRSSGKKARNEGLIELKRLSAKLDCLEQMNEALHAELQVLHRSNVSRLDDNNKVLNKPNSATTLRDIVNSERRNLEKSFTSEVSQDSKLPDINILSKRIQEMSIQLESSCRRCLELEDKCLHLESERKIIETKLDESLIKLEQTQMELEQSVSNVKEKDNQLLEKQCALLEANNNNILLSAKLDAITENVNQKQEQIEKYEIELSEKDDKMKELSKELEELRKESENFEIELKLKLESSQKQVDEAVNKRMEAEKKLIKSYQLQSELSSKLDQQIIQFKHLEDQLKHDERSWRMRLSECESRREEREVELRRKLDTAVITTSEAVLERTRLANDKLRLQQDLRAKESSHFSVMKELERRIEELETKNSELEAVARCKWEVRQEPIGARSPVCPRSPLCPRSPTSFVLRSPGGGEIGALSPPLSPRLIRPTQRHLSNPSSDYVSDQEHPYQLIGNNVWLSSNQGRCNNNSSPDLGIESDHHSLGVTGSTCQSKLSSLEILAQPHSLLSSATGDVRKLAEENEYLRKQLVKTKKALADTLAQITTANQKKRQVERDICKQIHKTHSVLQKARVNIEQENQPPQQT